MSTVVVAGALANKPGNGGEAWVRLSWLLGLRQLGFTTYLLEQISPADCVDAAGCRTAFETSVNLAYFRQVTQDFGLSTAASLICGNGDQIHGASASELHAIADAAVLLVNISGNLHWPALRRRFRRRAYVDIDPGFTQFWQAQTPGALGLEAHDLHFTIGENIGTPACDIATGSIAWRPTRQPVCLGDWTVSASGAPDRFTTVARWRSPFGAPEFGGRRFTAKHHEFRRVMAFPERVSQTCELALRIDAADATDLRRLRRHGWTVVDAASVGAPDTFREYVRTSGAEFSVAQGVYVATNSGWFSDRTVRYLASGKPALVQNTGFDTQYPVGDGLLAFRTLDEAVAGARDIDRRYAEHSAAARGLAERYFDAGVVLGRFAEDAGLAP